MINQTITDKDGVKRYLITLNVNGDARTVLVKGNSILANVLRDELNLTGTKKGCELGDCGSCTILLEGKPVDSCMVLAIEADGLEITTIEGVAVNSKLDAIQEAMINFAAVQCGYCTPGMVMVTVALLQETPNPTDEQIRTALNGHLCRCCGYPKLLDAVRRAAAEARR